jgi:signal transduction histidine kinase
LQDEERRRLARELHDSTGQKAAALGPKTRKALSECFNLSEQIVREVRTLSYLLHPPMLDEVGLGSAIRWYDDGVAQRGGLQIDLNLPENIGRLPAEVETALFRIVQETLTNTLLHSGSKRARIHLSQDSGKVTLEVTDEGRGIPPEVLNHPEGTLEKLGVGIVARRLDSPPVPADREVVMSG